MVVSASPSDSGLRREESHQVEQSKSVTSCCSKQGKPYLPPHPRKKNPNFLKYLEGLRSTQQASFATDGDDKQQTNLAKNREEACGRLADVLEGLSNEQNAGALPRYFPGCKDIKKNLKKL